MNIFVSRHTVGARRQYPINIMLSLVEFAHGTRGKTKSQTFDFLRLFVSANNLGMAIKSSYELQ